MVSLDTIFDLLSDERRRYALYYLYEQDGPVAVEELVETVTRWEDDSHSPDRHQDRIENATIEFQHTHLPKSESVEFIQYSPNEGVIEVSGAPPKFDALVTVARLIEQPASE